MQSSRVLKYVLVVLCLRQRHHLQRPVVTRSYTFQCLGSHRRVPYEGTGYYQTGVTFGYNWALCLAFICQSQSSGPNYYYDQNIQLPQPPPPPDPPHKHTLCSEMPRVICWPLLSLSLIIYPLMSHISGIRVA